MMKKVMVCVACFVLALSEEEFRVVLETNF